MINGYSMNIVRKRGFRAAVSVQRAPVEKQTPDRFSRRSSRLGYDTSRTWIRS